MGFLNWFIRRITPAAGIPEAAYAAGQRLFIALVNEARELKTDSVRFHVLREDESSRSEYRIIVVLIDPNGPDRVPDEHEVVSGWGIADVHIDVKFTVRTREHGMHDFSLYHEEYVTGLITSCMRSALNRSVELQEVSGLSIR